MKGPLDGNEHHRSRKRRGSHERGNFQYGVIKALLQQAKHRHFYMEQNTIIVPKTDKKGLGITRWDT